MELRSRQFNKSLEVVDTDLDLKWRRDWVYHERLKPITNC